MKLLVKASPDAATIASVTPASAGWRHVGFEAVRLAEGESIARRFDDEEMCVVVVSGCVTLQAAGTHTDTQQQWDRLFSRHSPFDDIGPHALYAPPGTTVRASAHGPVELAICTAPARGTLPVRLIEPGHLPSTRRGVAANTRYVRDILPQSEPAESLLVVEVRTPSGHSSSYPPHKHDADTIPAESVLEEIYYHRIDPPQGFVVQRVYTDARDLDETMSAEDRDVVLVPRGYHPVIVPYGYESYYLNVMAGPTRAWHFRNDPAHEWIVSTPSR
ncbi:5-deoxy-glucuronate isomerase [Paraburkholderia saeva]|uniref:5-deoxy-glucuronate isomerase n=1 Tax=Paraburkholderia saeva TaxID=2777537 RepID=A0A9N8X0R2_9BURK|nr:5-deoxy-glucuronate isomerase [Paraburkholderia saeva]CAG4887499.1 5-deoxy-glucuronate isomerase [Paraburkholderia saeva]CAG4895076.1 5-deoxy-glucuronate isomerase [Paraburkholderia saeva]